MIDLLRAGKRERHHVVEREGGDEVLNLQDRRADRRERDALAEKSVPERVELDDAVVDAEPRPRAAPVAVREFCSEQRGTVQGLLELADIPYVGAGVMASAVGMDKAAMKDMFRSHNLPTPKYVSIKRRDWETQPDRLADQLAAEIGYPCFIKPANMGSSVGVHKVHADEELAAAMNDAAQYDRKILAEYAVPDAREIECSVLGNDQPIASVPGEVVPGHEFYDYEAKYIDESSQLLIPAPIEPAVANRVRELAVEAFLALDCAGMARVDFLLARKSNELFLSELNTIPGFTSHSRYPNMMKGIGLSFGELLTRLIEQGMKD